MLQDERALAAAQRARDALHRHVRAGVLLSEDETIIVTELDPARSPSKVLLSVTKASAVPSATS
ncbi:hypothetical protein [Nonomuraea recticatena]|uniref:hypothetical protein n=1 Tax=Nonomuraea recticatena TaxID=46178 RepID=UPI00360F40A4